LEGVPPILERMNSLDEGRLSDAQRGPAQKGHRSFSALKNRNFRLLWIGGMFSHVGDDMQLVAVSWLVLELTDSPFLMGIAALFQGLPRLFFAPVGGVIADRQNRHRLLMIYQTSEMVLAFIFALMVLSGKIAYWHILLLLPFFGFLKAVYVIARQAYVFDLVGKDDLMNALALHSSAMNLAKIIGPSIAGILIGVVGVGWCLLINALSFIGILVCLLMMHPPEFFKKDLRYPSFLRDMGETFIYLKKDRTIFLLIMTSFSFMLFGLQSTVVLPLFSRYVLNAGASGFGFLMASMGVGAVVAGTIMAGMGDIRKKGLFFLLSTLFYGMLLLVFSASSWFIGSLVFILLVGMMEMFSRTLNQTLVQLLSPDTLRGRILGVYMLDRGVRPLGGFLMGSGASLLGAPLALAIGGGMCTVVALGLLFKSPRIRRL
jgi:MFS family permease